MAKNIFTNIDFNSNAALNFVIGSNAYDPSVGLVDGYTYYNTVRKCLRVYSDNKWVSLVDQFSVVSELPSTGNENIVYLLNRGTVSDGYNTYSAFVWKNNSYCQISGYKIPVSWNDITDKPDILKAEVRSIQDSSDNELYLSYN